METFSALLAICAGNSPVPGEFPAQWPVTRSFDVFFDLRPNQRLSKQPWGRWFETPSRPLWRHCNALLGFTTVSNFSVTPPAWAGDIIYHKPARRISITVGIPLDFFKIFVHNFNRDDNQNDCHRPFKNGGNFHQSRKHRMHCNWGFPHTYQGHHKRVMPANWGPCLIPHWQSVLKPPGYACGAV